VSFLELSRFTFFAESQVSLEALDIDPNTCIVRKHKSFTGIVFLECCIAIYLLVGWKIRSIFDNQICIILTRINLKAIGQCCSTQTLESLPLPRVESCGNSAGQCLDNFVLLLYIYIYIYI